MVKKACGDVVIADILEPEGRTLADEIGEHAIFSRLDAREPHDIANYNDTSLTLHSTCSDAPRPAATNKLKRGHSHDQQSE